LNGHREIKARTDFELKACSRRDQLLSLRRNPPKIGQSHFPTPQSSLFPIAPCGALFLGVFHVKHPCQKRAPASLERDFSNLFAPARVFHVKLF
jgi:hypothetical protein